MSATAAITYIESILAPDDSVPIKTLLSRLDKARSEASRFLLRHCKNVKELEDFLTDEANSEYFFVENKKVALFDYKLTDDKETTENFFELKVRQSAEPMDYMQLKDRYLGGAPAEVASFIARFYPAAEFKHFFRSKPNLFLLKNDKVFHIETECVNYYKKMVKNFGGGAIQSVRGYIGQAPKHIQTYINEHCWGNDFKFFLQKHNDVFKINNQGRVSLVEQF